MPQGGDGQDGHQDHERRLQQLDESDLLRALQAGDDDAFVVIMQRLENPLRRYIRRLIGDTDTGDDIVQDVFFTLYRKCDHVDASRGLRPWLFRVARNRCYDELRRQGRFQSVSLDADADAQGQTFSLAETLPDPSEPTEELAHWLFIQLVVREAMEKLPENQRQALILYAEEQMSYAEIAVATNTNPGTVRSRLSHARKTLRRLVPPWVLAALDSDPAAAEPPQSVAKGSAHAAIR
jgi:RNA polymerase sigma-70 factor (ECF subfamily)